MPTADDLFRPTAAPEQDTGDPDVAEATGAARSEGTRPDKRPVVSAVPDRATRSRSRRSSGRIRHDEKMTVYVTAEELLDLEHARLSLRRDQGIAVDRGRLVREALAIVLADLEQHGDDSDLVKRLQA